MGAKPKIRRPDLLFPELSYELVGVLLEVNKIMGPGHPEKAYQKAVAAELKKKEILFVEQAPVKLTYKNTPIGTYFADFVIEDKIVLELKTDRFFTRKNIDQTVGYLQALNLQLGILVNFTRNGLEYKRLINLNK